MYRKRHQWACVVLGLLLVGLILFQPSTVRAADPPNNQQTYEPRILDRDGRDIRQDERGIRRRP
jgi:hypothetical protein